MLAIGTAELAQACYEAWRYHEIRYGAAHRSIPPKWEHLNSNERRCWMTVATAAGKKLADALEMHPVG